MQKGRRDKTKKRNLGWVGLLIVSLLWLSACGSATDVQFENDLYKPDNPNILENNGSGQPIPVAWKPDWILDAERTFWEIGLGAPIVITSMAGEEVVINLNMLVIDQNDVEKTLEQMTEAADTHYIQVTFKMMLPLDEVYETTIPYALDVIEVDGKDALGRFVSVPLSQVMDMAGLVWVDDMVTEISFGLYNTDKKLDEDVDYDPKENEESPAIPDSGD
jgi:hypothetical protein